MKNVVLLAPYFLPRRRVSVWRPFKFAIHLKEFGWKPHIITLKSEGSFTDKEKKLLKDIPIYTIASPLDFTGRSESSRKISVKSSSNSSNLSKKFSPLLKSIDRHFPVDTWLPLFFIRERYIKKVITRTEPALIWSTGDPWSGHITAYRMSKKFDLPWAADFRDPWNWGGMNLKERSKFSSKIDKYCENKLIKNASLLTFTAKATEKLYQRHFDEYKLNTATIYNSFDFKLYERVVPEPVNFDSSYLNLIFFGSFRSRSPADPFIEILEKMKQETASAIRMYSFGSLKDETKKKAEQAGALGHFKQLPPIPPERALSFLGKADLLWLSTHHRRKYIIPAKLWDYLATEKPILSMVPNPEVAEILKKTQTGKQFKLNQTDQIIKILEQCVLEKRSEHERFSLPFFKPDQKQIATFDSIHTTRSLAKSFDNLA